MLDSKPGMESSKYLSALIQHGVYEPLDSSLMRCADQNTIFQIEDRGNSQSLTYARQSLGHSRTCASCSTPVTSSVSFIVLKIALFTAAAEQLVYFSKPARHHKLGAVRQFMSLHTIRGSIALMASVDASSF